MARPKKEPSSYTLVSLSDEDGAMTALIYEKLEDVDLVIEGRDLDLEKILVFPCAPLKLEKRLTIAPSSSPKPSPKPSTPRKRKSKAGAILDEGNGKKLSIVAKQDDGSMAPVTE